MPRKSEDQLNHGNLPGGLLGHLGGSGKGRNTPFLTYDDADAGLLVRAVSNVVFLGGSIQFGRTSKGSAFSVRLYIDGEGETFYPADVPALNILLAQISAYTP